MDDAEKILNIIYTEVYGELGVNFQSISKGEEDWFLEYSMPHQRQEEILNRILSKSNLSLRGKRSVEISYWLGCSPNSN